jgi:hypothetical protein
MTDKQNEDDLTLFVHWKEFIEWLFAHTEKFPRKVRFSLSVRIENLALDVMEDLIEARYSKDKKAILQHANILLEKLRIMLRLTHTMRHLSNQSYEHACKRINEAGRMLGGWLKQQKAETRP